MSAAAREKVSTISRIQPLLRLVCAVGRINDGSAGRWNGDWIPGILDAGGRRAAAPAFMALW